MDARDPLQSLGRLAELPGEALGCAQLGLADPGLALDGVIVLADAGAVLSQRRRRGLTTAARQRRPQDVPTGRAR